MYYVNKGPHKNRHASGCFCVHYAGTKPTTVLHFQGFTLGLLIIRIILYYCMDCLKDMTKTHNHHLKQQQHVTEQPFTLG